MQKIFCIILLLFLLYGIACAKKNDSLNPRETLAKKYQKIESISKILFPDLNSDEDYKSYVTAVRDLHNDKSHLVTKFLVDLIDFNLGETTTQLVYYSITTRDKKETIYLLKQKLLTPPLSSEIDVKNRNELILDLIKMELNDVKYICPTDDRPTDKERQAFRIYSFQMKLEQHYKKDGFYPKVLSKYDALILGDQKYDYKSTGGNYFLKLAGSDGIFGSKDDPLLPFNNNLHCYPGEENVGKRITP